MVDAGPDREALLRREAAAHARWQALVAALGPEALRADGWRMREVEAHLAGWQRLTVERLQALRRGEVTEPPEWDAFNAALRAAWRNRSWAAVRAESAAARMAFRSVMGEMTGEELSADEGLGAFLVSANGEEHYLEHLGDFG